MPTRYSLLPTVWPKPGLWVFSVTDHRCDVVKEVTTQVVGSSRAQPSGTSLEEYFAGWCSPDRGVWSSDERIDRSDSPRRGERQLRRKIVYWYSSRRPAAFAIQSLPDYGLGVEAPSSGRSRSPLVRHCDVITLSLPTTAFPGDRAQDGLQRHRPRA
jgi:hypothetical protein